MNVFSGHTFSMLLATMVQGDLHFAFEINISWRFPYFKNISEYTLICKIVKRIGPIKCGKHRLTSSHVACRIFEPLSVARLPLRRLKTFKRNLCSSSANYCYFLNQRNSFLPVLPLKQYGHPYWISPMLDCPLSMHLSIVMKHGLRSV